MGDSEGLTLAKMAAALQSFYDDVLLGKASIIVSWREAKEIGMTKKEYESSDCGKIFVNKSREFYSKNRSVVK